MARRWHWTKRNVAELFPGVAKTCPGCGYIKPLSSFATNRTKKGGVQSRCKLCRSGAMKREHEREAVARGPAVATTVTAYRYAPVRGGLLLAGYAP